MSSRPVFLLLSVVAMVVAAGCSGGSNGSDTTTETQPLPNFDPEFVSRAMAQGVNEGAAITLALTTVAVVESNGDSVKLAASFPTGDKADVLIRIAPSNGIADSPARTSTTETDKVFEFNLIYHIAEPPPPTASTSSPHGLRGVPDRSRRSATAEDTGYTAIIDATINKADIVSVEHFAHQLKELGAKEASEATKSFAATLEATKSLVEALKLN
jgi:hypothetical protein